MNHASLTEERWSQFSVDQQIMMIANEMNRASKLLDPDMREYLRGCYERILRLVDLTVSVQTRSSLRKELLRWRELIGELYLLPLSDPERHRALFRSLLLLNPVTARQIPYVL